MATLGRFRLANVPLVRGPLRLSVAHHGTSRLAKRKQPSNIALEHFDAFYPKVYGANEWRSMRLALLSQKKYCAVLNPYAETNDVHDRLRDLGAEKILAAAPPSKGFEESAITRSELPEHIPMIEEEIPQEFLDSSRVIKKGQSEPMLSFVPATEMIYQEEVIHEEDYYNFLQPETEIMLKTHKPLPFLPLSIYAYPAGSVYDFPPPLVNANGLYDYYLMDAASLLPVMALGITEGDDFADFCAAPGGKTLAVAFMDRTRSHFCTDESPGRIKRLRNSLSSYLPKEARENIEVKQIDMLQIREEATYDKILVDVPCSNDRYALFEDENSLFRNTRIQERLHLPETQSTILKCALKKLRVGGALVYSTCTMSPIQNDSVVHMSLQSFKEMKFIVTSLEKSFEPLKLYFQLHNFRYGQLVMPYLPNNFGPMYISRIERVQ